MSWQAATYLVLGAVLAGGFAWFERSRPGARMVALVAALSALAVAGRLAFAPLPNVVATTDIVLITGFAVGAAPGFAVGALAALVSNLWLGEGPWTPWQMAGWGLVGLGGAGLATVTRSRLGRVGLATACGVAGFAYGALLDFSVMVSYGGEQSLDRYLAISARGVPFNVAHVVGNVALALAAGPALVRMISRYRSRFEFEWLAARRGAATTIGATLRRSTGGLSLVALIVAGLILPASGARADGTRSALGWLMRVQNPDGGFGASAGSSSSSAITGWAALGLEAAGLNPLDVRNGGASPIAFLRSDLGAIRSTGDLERTVLALEGAGISPRRFGGRDLVGELRSRRSASGSFEGQVNLTAFGILALRSAGTGPGALRRSASWLRRAQNRDGGWGFRTAAGSDPDSTGAALQGMAAAAGGGSAMRRGASYLRRAQRGDGGFSLAGTSSSNSQSTAWAIQGLIAAGAHPAAVRVRGHSPLRYLAARQAGDGHYRYSSSSDQTPVWVTAQAIVAAKREAFPLAAVARSQSHRSAQRDHASGGPRDGAGAGRQADTAARSRGPGPGVAGPGAAPGGPGGAQAGHGSRTPRGAGDPIDATLVARQDQADQSNDGGGEVAYVAVGFGLLITALAAGFLWYRRRLP